MGVYIMHDLCKEILSSMANSLGVNFKPSKLVNLLSFPSFNRCNDSFLWNALTKGIEFIPAYLKYALQPKKLRESIYQQQLEILHDVYLKDIAVE